MSARDRVDGDRVDECLIRALNEELIILRGDDDVLVLLLVLGLAIPCPERI